MCGIVGYLGKTSCLEFILGGLKLLQNRGYDSVGITTIQEGALHTIKYASTAKEPALDKLDRTCETAVASTVAIGHTRWATHGGKTDANAHPHHDTSDRLSLVHNGIIENFHELKEPLIEAGYIFRSQTDTEVIAVLLGFFLDGGMEMDDAIQAVVSKLSGTWALAIVHRDYPDSMWICRNGSPLLLGIDDDFVMVASEAIAFANLIQTYIVLDNQDVIKITKTNGIIQYSQNIHRYATTRQCVENVDYEPSPYAHWMMKEIADQPDAVQRAINHGGRIVGTDRVKLGGLDTYRERLLECNHIILLGCGTSYYAGVWSTHIFKMMECFDTVAVYDGAEFQAYDIPTSGKTGLIFLSQSGETKDLHRCIQIAKDCDVVTVGIINVPDSLLAREVDCGVYLNAGREMAVASTKSFTAQCVVLSLVAVWFAQSRGGSLLRRQKIIQDIRCLSAHIHSVLDKRPRVQGLVSKFVNASSVFLLGKGGETAVACEGALKIKEVTYVHAEGYSTSALKHGPFALLDQSVPVILLDIGEAHRDKTRNAYQEIAAREAPIVRITDQEWNCPCGSDNTLLVPVNGTFGGLLANVHVQMLSYEIAVQKQYNPDYPRNLAKVVTVE